MDKLTPEEYEAMALACERSAQDDAKIGWHRNARHAQGKANAFRIAAATLRWYAKTETGGDDHAERQAIIAACKEATNGDA